MKPENGLPEPNSAANQSVITLIVAVITLIFMIISFYYNFTFQIIPLMDDKSIREDESKRSCQVNPGGEVPVRRGSYIFYEKCSEYMKNAK